MAVSLKISDINQDVDYDFTIGASKVRFVAGTFDDQVSIDGVENGIVTFDTITKGDTYAEIQAGIKEIEILLELHKRLEKNPFTHRSVYLEVGKNGATPGRARIVGWTRKDHSSPVQDILLDNNLSFISTWTIQRVPFWEDISTTSFSFPVGCNMAAVDKDGITGFTQGLGDTFFAKGTAPGRIVKTDFVENDLHRDVDRFWFGFKEVNGDLVSGDYAPEISLGTDGTGENTLISGHSVTDLGFVDGLAKSNLCVNIDFNQGDEYAPQLFIEGPLAQWPSDSNIYRSGKYLVILRMRMSGSTSECRVNMFQNYGQDWDNALVDTFQDVYIDDDAYHFYEMGVIDFPPDGYRAEYPNFEVVNAPIDFNYIGFGAERLSGSNDLRLDYFALIPYEHYFSMKNIKSFTGDGGASSESYKAMYTTEDGYTYGFSLKYSPGEGHHVTKLELEQNDWSVPVFNDMYFVGVGVGDPAVYTDPDDPETMDDENLRIRILYHARYWSLNID